MTNTLKCYEADFGESAVIPQTPIPENWLDVLADACLATGLMDTHPKLTQEFERHLGINSNFTYKTELTLELKKVYQRFLATGEEELPANQKSAIANKIQEGINTCTIGFYNRIILINQNFSTPGNVKALLTKVRHNLVNKAAIKAIANRPFDAGNHVHLYNHFFLMGHQHFGVQMIQEFDPHSGNMSDEDIGKLLLTEFQKEFESPLHLMINLCDLVRSLLEEHFYYTGRKESGCTMSDANQWAAFLNKIGIDYNSCFFFKYPYTNSLGQAVLIRSSSNPKDKSLVELKTMLDHNNGIIFFNNSLFYTDLTNSNPSKQINLLYEFSDTDDEDALKVKEQFLNLTLDADTNNIHLVSSQQLDKIRAGISMNCMLGTVVDLDWQKINYSLFNCLLEEKYLKRSLQGSEEFMLTLFQAQFIPDTLKEFIPLLADNYIQSPEDFCLFLELFSHLHEESKIQLIQLYLRFIPLDQKYQVLLKLILEVPNTTLFATVIEEEFKDFNLQKLNSELIRYSPTINLSIMLKLHAISADKPELFQIVKQFLQQYSTDQLFQMITWNLNRSIQIEPTLMLIDCFEVDQQLELFETIQDYLNQLEIKRYQTFFLEAFIKRILKAPTAVQELILTRGNAKNNNLIMDLLHHQATNLALIEELINLITHFNSTSITTLFTLQNTPNQDTILLYICQKTPSLLVSTLKKFSEPKILIQDEDLYAMLVQVNHEGNHALFYIANSTDKAAPLEMLKIISRFPSSLQKKSLEQWIKTLATTRSKKQVCQALAEFLLCMDEIRQEELLLWLLTTEQYPYVFDETFTPLSLPLLQKNIFSDHPLKFPQISDFNVYLSLINVHQPDLAVALVKRCFIESTPINLINELLHQMIIKQHSECALELLRMGAEPCYFPGGEFPLIGLAIKNNLYVVVNSMLNDILRPQYVQSSLVIMLAIHKESFNELLKKILLRHQNINLNQHYIKDTGNYALHLAVIHSIPTEILALLCRAGADFMKANSLGQSALDLALASQQLGVVMLFFQHSSIHYTKKQTQQIKKTLIQSGNLFLLKYFFDKIQRDNATQATHSLFFSKKPQTIPSPNNALSWKQFLYLLDHFNTEKENLNFFRAIELQVNQLNADRETKNLIITHAKACCNYLRETKGLKHGFHQSTISKLFLKRLLCEGRKSKQEIEQESLDYIRGTGVYKSKLSFTAGSGYEKHSSLAYAYDLGLFKKSVTSLCLENFAEQPKEVRQFFTESVKRYGHC